MTRILVPLAHAASNARVLELAATMANGIKATITLLHVYEPPNGMIGIVPGATVEGELEAERAVGEQLLASAQSTLKRAGVAQVTSLLEHAPSAHYAIVMHARTYDLIVMGTHGRRGLQHAVLGSVAEQVLRDAPCPVLTIHL